MKPSNPKLNELIAVIKLSNNTNPEDQINASKAFDILMRIENKKYMNKIVSFTIAACKKKQLIKLEDQAHLTSCVLERIYLKMYLFKSDETIEDINHLEEAFSKWIWVMTLNFIKNSIRKRKNRPIFKDSYDTVDMDGKVTTKSEIENYLDHRENSGIAEERAEKLEKVIYWAMDNILTLKESEILKATIFRTGKNFPQDQLDSLMGKFKIENAEYFWKIRSRGRVKVAKYIKKNKHLIWD